MWTTFKTKVQSMWARIRAAFISVLVALGLMVAIPAGAGPINFSWTNPTQNVDGTVFDPATELAEIRLYCNGDTTPTFISVGPVTSFGSDVPPGTYTCYATAFSVYGQESGPSNTVVKVVERAPPNPPVLN